MVSTRSTNRDVHGLGSNISTLLIGNLQGRHHDILTRAISNVLSSPIAETTYGQIIDGVPPASVMRAVYDGELCCPGHPLLDCHLNLSPDILTRVKHLRTSFNPDTLEIKSTVSPDI
jgi:hypothetical protein